MSVPELISPASVGVDPSLVIGVLMFELGEQGVVTVDTWNRIVEEAVA